MDGRRVLQRVEVPPLGGHGVRQVVDVQRARRERHHADERLADDGQVRAQRRVLTQRAFELLRRADDLVARRDVAALALRHQAGPAAGDEGPRPRAGDAGRRVHAAGPVGRDEVLVGAQLRVAVEHGAVALGREAVLVRVAGDAGHAFEGEVEGRGFEAGAGEEGDEEGAEAAVDVQGEVPLEGEPREGGDVVGDAVREVGGRADEQDRVAVDEARDGGEGGAVGGGRAGDEVRFDFEVGTRFAEGRVRGFGEDPGGSRFSCCVCGEGKRGNLHLGFCDASFDVGFLPCAETGHQDGLCAAACSDAGCSGRGVEHRQDHGDDLGLHLPDAREHVGMYRVRDAELLERFGLELDQVTTAMIDSSADKTVLPSRVLHLAQLVQLRSDLLVCPSFLRQCQVVAYAWPFGHQLRL